VSRGPVTFKQRDVAAAIRAAVQAGQQVDRVEIRRDGSIVVILTNGKEQLAADGGADCANEWDTVLK
jgi:hypothetical protein